MTVITNEKIKQNECNTIINTIKTRLEELQNVSEIIKNRIENYRPYKVDTLGFENVSISIRYTNYIL